MPVFGQWWQRRLKVVGDRYAVALDVPVSGAVCTWPSASGAGALARANTVGESKKFTI
ncbi:MAG: hypothetical protein QOE94_2294 [Mycobacterium sp.]|jgi:hypothetical protein|nr:hypothetical protein [Mycobacterium sp.]